MNCTPSTPCRHSNARSSLLSNPIAASLFIELDIDINNSSNSNCTLENEYLNDRPSSAEMSDSVSGRCIPLKSGQKRKNSKEVYNVRKKLVAVENN